MEGGRERMEEGNIGLTHQMLLSESQSQAAVACMHAERRERERRLQYSLPLTACWYCWDTHMHTEKNTHIHTVTEVCPQTQTWSNTSHTDHHTLTYSCTQNALHMHTQDHIHSHKDAGCNVHSHGYTLRWMNMYTIQCHRQCCWSYFDSIALQATSYFTLDSHWLQQSYPREKWQKKYLTTCTTMQIWM